LETFNAGFCSPNFARPIARSHDHGDSERFVVAPKPNASDGTNPSSTPSKADLTAQQSSESQPKDSEHVVVVTMGLKPPSPTVRKDFFRRLRIG